MSVIPLKRKAKLMSQRETNYTPNPHNSFERMRNRHILLTGMRAYGCDCHICNSDLDGPRRPIGIFQREAAGCFEVCEITKEEKQALPLAIIHSKPGGLLANFCFGEPENRLVKVPECIAEVESLLAWIMTIRELTGNNG